MSSSDDISFLTVTDIESLSSEDADRRDAYWAARTVSERLKEMQRLRVAKWGERAYGPMKKVIRVRSINPK